MASVAFFPPTCGLDICPCQPIDRRYIEYRQRTSPKIRAGHIQNDKSAVEIVQIEHSICAEAAWQET